MINQLETEYELELIGRGRKELRKYLEEKVSQGCYSNTQPGRIAFYRYLEGFAACLQEVTDQAHKGLILRTNISQSCQEIRSHMNYLKDGCLHLSTATILPF